jgi:outer membrane protein assembly factor BamD
MQAGVVRFEGLGLGPLPRMRLRALALALAFPAALAACEGPPPKTGLSYTADAQRAYEAALEEFKAHNWIESQALMREVKRKYGYSKYARLAELRIADADYEQEKYADAIREYKQFVHDHRSDTEDVAYARARVAEATYAEIPESFLLPAGEERDQGGVVDAYKEMRSFLHDFPRDNFDAAVARIQYALRNYGPSVGGPGGEVRAGSGLEPEALLLLGETYLKMHKWADAREAFSSIVKQYVGSPLLVQARNYLDDMQRRGV